MKFPINIFGKKSTIESDHQNTTTPNRDNMENLNVLNHLSSLHRSQSVPGSSVFGFKHTTNTKNIVDNLQNVQNPPMTNINVSNSDDSVLDINSNITFKHRNCIRDSGNSDSLSNTDSVKDSRNKDALDSVDCENNNNILLKRHSLERSDSCPWDDSGFSSSSCLSDEKDDVSVKSHDSSFDYDEKCGDSSSVYGTPFPIPLIVRSRSYSLDSMSSDISDSSELSSKLSSSLPSDFTDNESILSSFDQTKCTKLSSTGALRHKRKLVIKSKVSPQTISYPRKDNDLNNNWTQMPSKNLQSYLRKAPFQFASTFQNHGLLSLVGCICYTLFLVFLLGFLALVWQIFSRFVSKTELRDLRDNLIESRRKRETAAVSSSER